MSGSADTFREKNLFAAMSTLLSGSKNASFLLLPRAAQERIAATVNSPR